MLKEDTNLICVIQSTEASLALSEFHKAILCREGCGFSQQCLALELGLEIDRVKYRLEELLEPSITLSVYIWACVY